MPNSHPNNDHFVQHLSSEQFQPSKSCHHSLSHSLLAIVSRLQANNPTRLPPKTISEGTHARPQSMVFAFPVPLSHTPQEALLGFLEMSWQKELKTPLNTLANCHQTILTLKTTQLSVRFSPLLALNLFLPLPSHLTCRTAFDFPFKHRHHGLSLLDLLEQ